MTKTVLGEGMPFYRNPFERGNLYIKFEVNFPQNNFVSEPQLKVSEKACARVYHSVHINLSSYQHFAFLQYRILKMENNLYTLFHLCTFIECHNQ